MTNETNEPSNPRPEIDERLLLALSASLDGQADVRDRDVISGDPRAGELRRHLETVRAQLREPVLTNDERRDHHIGAALAIFDDEIASDRNVTSIGARRWFRPTLSVAAAILVLGTLGVVMSITRDGGGDDLADPAAAEVFTLEAAEDDAEPAPLAAPDADADASADSTDMMVADAAPSEAGSARELNSTDDLRDFVNDHRDFLEGDSDRSKAEGHRCAPADATLIGEAAYTGLPVLVVVLGDRVQALSTEDCAVVAETSLQP